MKTALFVDFDNVFSGLKKISSQCAERFARHPSTWLRWLIEDLDRPRPGECAPGTESFRRVLVRRCYLNPVLFSHYRRPFHEAGFEIVDCPPMTATGKTSTDIHMVLDTMDALQDATRFDEFVMLSADARAGSTAKWDRCHWQPSLNSFIVKFRVRARVVGQVPAVSGA